MINMQTKKTLKKYKKKPQCFFYTNFVSYKQILINYLNCLMTKLLTTKLFLMIIQMNVNCQDSSEIQSEVTNLNHLIMQGT